MVRIARHAARLRMARGSSGSGDYNSSSVAAAAAHYLDKRQSRVPVSGNGQQPTDTGSGSDTSQQTLTRETLTSGGWDASLRRARISLYVTLLGPSLI